MSRELEGMRFGKLTIGKFIKSDKQGRWWNCVCDCGNKTISTTGRLISGNPRSCGCGQREAARLLCISRGTHFMRKTRIYNIWRSMNQRCFDKNSINYKFYGERGITICEEWLPFIGFLEWVLKSGYSDKLTIDRIDSNGNYNPKNCRWATYKQQANNRRNSKTITFHGKTMNMSDWANELNIRKTTLSNRIREKWPISKALTLPVDYRNRVNASA